MAKIKKLSKKITEEELLNLQGLVKAINSLQIDIGGLEVQKAQMLSGILNFAAKTLARSTTSTRSDFSIQYL